MIEVVRYTQDRRNQWDEFLTDSKNSTFLFNRNFVEYHSDRFNDYSLLILDNKKLKALLPANIDSNGLLHSHEGLTYGGFVFKKYEKLNNILKYIYATLEFLFKNKINIIIYKSIPKFYNTIGSDEIDYALFILKATLIRRDIAISINLKDKINYQKRRIRSIKKAKKERIQIVEVNSFTEYWKQILLPNLKERFGVSPVHTLEEITFLKEKFPKNIRQFNAYLNNKIIAGTTIFETPVVAHAQYISASEEGRKYGGIDLLFYYLIESEFKDKAYFDFGICNENEGKQLNFGLLDWKEGFGGRSFAHNFYEIRTSEYHLLKKVIK